MWCKICRQDVPALPSGDKQTLCCPRCGEAICADPQEIASGDSPNFADSGGPDSSAIGVPQAREGFGETRKPSRGFTAPIDKLSALPAAYDGWELDEQLRHIQRVLHAGKGDSPIFAETKTATVPREAMRFDPPQAGPQARHVSASNRPGRQRRTAGNRGLISSFVTWFVLVLGTTSFACGGIVLGWSLATGRQELWNVGLPVALVGQIALLVGLVLQIDRLWHDNREAAAKLDDVDQQIHELKATTMLLGASQGPASATFYSHLAGGAGPQLLLTDLKSQLDLLAMKIAQEM